MNEFSLTIKLQDERFCDCVNDKTGRKFDDCPALDTNESTCRAVFDFEDWQNRSINFDQQEDGSVRPVRPDWCPLKKPSIEDLTTFVRKSRAATGYSNEYFMGMYNAFCVVLSFITRDEPGLILKDRKVEMAEAGTTKSQKAHVQYEIVRYLPEKPEKEKNEQ